ncbi:MAG: WD40 repeat domain-containing protein [Verrucomicrobia bacterium]|nr:WD40 repeat domain-containing protein [Verrucomicrobiota bacterium]
MIDINTTSSERADQKTVNKLPSELWMGIMEYLPRGGWECRVNQRLTAIFERSIAAYIPKPPPPKLPYVEILEQRVREYQRAYAIVLRLLPPSYCISTQHTGEVVHFAFSPDRTLLATASMDCTTKIWHVTTGLCLFTLNASGSVERVAFSPDGKRLVTASVGDIIMWDVTTGRPLFTFNEHAGDWVVHVAFSPDGTRLGTRSWDDTVKMWDVTTGRCLATLRGHTEPVSHVAFAPDGTLLGTTSREDGTAKMWDLATGHCLATLRGHTDVVASIALSPNGKRFATASMDDTVKIWDVEHWDVDEHNEHMDRCLSTLYGHAGDWVTHVTFSPDGTFLVTRSWDDTVKMWDVTTGRCLSTLHFTSDGRTDQVKRAAFSQDGTRLGIASPDRILTVWVLDQLPGSPPSSLTKRIQDLAEQSLKTATQIEIVPVLVETPVAPTGD